MEVNIQQKKRNITVKTRFEIAEFHLKAKKIIPGKHVSNVQCSFTFLGSVYGFPSQQIIG